MRHALEVLTGADTGRRYELNRAEVLVGRGMACHLVLESLAVSRTHARLVLEGDTYAIEDLGSRSHTYVNDRMCQMLGYRRDEIVGTGGIDDTVAAEGPVGVLPREFARAYAGEPASFEADLRAKDGHAVAVVVSPKPILDSDDIQKMVKG